jgi:hypothetical protein
MNTFEYLAVLVSIIVGLSLAHILLAVGRVISNPGQEKPYWVHSIWVINAFLFLVYFWWFQLSYRSVEVWDSALYSFVVLYAVVLFLWCAVLVPSSPKQNYRDYYYSRRRWIFGFLIAIGLLDIVDAVIKPQSYLEGQSGWVWALTVLFFVALPGLAMVSRRAAYHGFLAVIFMWQTLSNLLFRQELGG